VNTVEVRCPVGPKKLFTKLKLGEEFATILASNLIEFSCSDCAKRIGKEQNTRVRVFHSFNFIGELISTRVQGQWECGPTFE
jgi:hypothetical protein